MGKKILEFTVQLGRKRLIGGKNQRGSLSFLNHIGDSEGFTGAGHPQQCHACLTVVEALQQPFDRGWLVACRVKFGHQLKIFRHQGFCISG